MSFTPSSKMSSEKRTRSTANQIDENLNVLCAETDKEYNFLQKKMRANRMVRKCAALFPPANTIQDKDIAPSTPVRNETMERIPINDIRLDWLDEKKKKRFQSQIKKHLFQTKKILCSYY